MDPHSVSFSSMATAAKAAKLPADRTESKSSLIRRHNERKSISVTKRENGHDSINSQPKKSRSASDLLAVKVRASVPCWPGNGGRCNDVTNNGSSYETAGTPVSSKTIDPNTKRATVASYSPQEVNESGNAMDSYNEVDAGKLAHRERRFRRLFRNVPTTETLLCRYACAYVSDLGLLLQGHLYVSNKWICFHSNVFGIEKIIEIPTDSVTSVSKSHTAKIIPNAVKIKAGGKYYLFGSLLSRDNTYRMLVNVTVRGNRRAGSQGEVKHDSARDLCEPREPDEDEIDDGSSMSSSFTADTSSNSTDERRTTTNGTVNGCSTGQVVWRRLFSSMDYRQPNAVHSLANPRAKSKEGDFAKQSAAQWLLPHLFFRLPKTLMILIICIVLITFLFLCATVLTIRLMYIRNPQPVWSHFTPQNSDSYGEVILSRQTLETMGVLVDSTMRILEQVKYNLDELRREIQNGLDDATASSVDISQFSSAGEKSM